MNRLPSKNQNRNANRTVTVGVNFSPEQDKRLTDEAKRTGMTKSAMIRAILDKYFEIPLEDTSARG